MNLHVVLKVFLKNRFSIPDYGPDHLPALVLSRTWKIFEMCKSNGFSILDWKQTKNERLWWKTSNRFRIIGFLFQQIFAIVYNWYFQFENDIHWIEFQCSVVHYFQD